MGGGWYDRSFAFRNRQSLPPGLLVLASQYSKSAHCQLKPGDIPVDAICTELTTLLFTTTVST